MKHIDRVMGTKKGTDGGYLRRDTPFLQPSFGVKCIHGSVEGPRKGLHPTLGRTVHRSP
jgi:hypothetical protein